MKILFGKEYKSEKSGKLLLINTTGGSRCDSSELFRSLMRHFRTLFDGYLKAHSIHRIRVLDQIVSRGEWLNFNSAKTYEVRVKV